MVGVTCQTDSHSAHLRAVKKLNCFSIILVLVKIALIFMLKAVQSRIELLKLF